MFDQRPVEALIMLEEEKVGKGSVYHVRMSPRKLDQLQTFLTTVPAPPEGCGILLWPRWSCVGLHGHHVQTYSVHWMNNMFKLFISASVRVMD